MFLIKIVLILLFLVKIEVGSADTLSSQDPSLPSGQYATHLDEFEATKAQLDILLRKHAELEKENNALENELAEIQESLEQEKKAVEGWRQKWSLENKLNDKENSALSSLHNKIKALDDERLLKESRNAYLRSQLIELDDQQRIRNLQLSDLGYQRKELQMDFKLKEFQLEEHQQKQGQEIERIKKSIEVNKEQQKKIEAQINTLENEHAVYPGKIEQLQGEVSRLEFQVGAVERQKALKEKENNYLKDKKVYETRALEDEFWKAQEEQANLQRDVRDLETKLDAMNEIMDASLVSQDHKIKLTSELIRIDSENQSLRDRIVELQQKIEPIQ